MLFDVQDNFGQTNKSKIFKALMLLPA